MNNLNFNEQNKGVIKVEGCDGMSFIFDFDKFKKGESDYYDDYDEFDYEYSDELFYNDEYDDQDMI